MTLPRDVVIELHDLMDQLDHIDDLPEDAQDAALTRVERRLDQVSKAYPAPAQRGYEPAPRFREVSTRATYQTPLGARRGGLW